jgi:hypothetical protein
MRLKAPQQCLDVTKVLHQFLVITIAIHRDVCFANENMDILLIMGGLPYSAGSLSPGYGILRWKVETASTYER